MAEDMDLTSLELITDNEGVEYAEISSKKDLMLFYNILKSDDRVNGWLTQDIDVENGEVSVNLQTYRGIFEGNGHTISNMKNEMSAGGFCRTLKGIVRNVCFENISASDVWCWRKLWRGRNCLFDQSWSDTKLSGGGQ